MANFYFRGALRLLPKLAGGIQILRMLWIAPLCALLLRGKMLLSAALLLLLCLLDGAAAYLSRHCGLITRTGAMLDSIAAPLILAALLMCQNLLLPAVLALLCIFISLISAGIVQNRQEFCPLTANWEKGISVLACLPVFCGMHAISAILILIMLIFRCAQLAWALRSQ